MSSKLVCWSIAGAVALASTCALADQAQKEDQLTKMIGIGNPNAPARGEAIARSSLAPREPLSLRLADTNAHEQALDVAIATGNPNAPARGQAIATSAMKSALPLRHPALLHEEELDTIISAGNPNAPARGAAIAASGHMARG